MLAVFIKTAASVNIIQGSILQQFKYEERGWRYRNTLYKIMNEYRKILDSAIIKAGIASFIGGMIIHIFGLVNVLQNSDNISVLPSGYGTGLPSGRWALTILGDLCENLWGNYNLPYINGIIFIALLAIATIFLMFI